MTTIAILSSIAQCWIKVLVKKFTHTVHYCEKSPASSVPGLGRSTEGVSGRVQGLVIRFLESSHASVGLQQGVAALLVYI